MLLIDEFYCIGDEQEVKNFQRDIAIDDALLLSTYLELSSENKRIVNSVLQELTSKKEFFGYNLERFIKAYQTTDAKISQLKISTQIFNDAQYISEQLADRLNYSFADEITINKHIDIAKNNNSLKKSTDGYKNNLEHYIQAICEYFLIDIELLERGMGKIYIIKDEWFDRYMNDSEFRKLADEDISSSWSTRLHIQKYEEYLRANGKLSNEDSILEEKWAVITYSGAYLMLKKHKGTENEAKAIECLIKELYELQSKYNLQGE